MKLNHSEICALCGKGPEDFVSKRAYKLHLTNKSHTEILLACNQCDKSFSTKTRLNMHKKRLHIIQDHLKYYLKETNQGLDYHTDQLVESMHQHTN